MKNIERIYGVDSAIENIKKTMTEMNLKYEVEEYNTDNNNIKTILVKSNEVLSSGKGFGNQSLASGLFEFLEHYIYENKISKNRVKKINFDELKEIFEYDNAVDYFFFEKKKNKEYFAIEFNEYNGKSSFFLPEALIYIYENKEYTELRKATVYSSNNGIAIGMNKKEAILHALNELIERQSLSKHYIDVFMKGDIPLKINKFTLTKRLKEILFEVEKEIGEEIEIVQLKNEFDLYAYLVYPKNKDIRKFYKGSGCSLLSEYALERAILELLQSYHLTDITEQENLLKKEKIFIENNLKKYLEIFNLNYIYDTYKEINFENNSLNSQDLKDMIEFIIKKLYLKGYKVYLAKLFEKNNIVCIKVVIPNFEHFHLVAEGVPVVPNIPNFNEIIEKKENEVINYDNN
ncbi:YcaO-like family protein [Oceanivirga salmonicida]|uniref:YcaO-like family protein n=1 Tax=Oceanivirga salmonicida TaxID=1769291 RepID=UPI00082E6676|nr:YcaO-like family protein [Oceanivirga salmonicida]